MAPQRRSSRPETRFGRLCSKHPSSRIQRSRRGSGFGSWCLAAAKARSFSPMQSRRRSHCYRLEQRARLTVTQQARAEDVEKVKQAYARLGVPVEVSPFFTDMAKRIADAHLVMSRSGASTVSEIAVIGRPALFVPYPHALDHDQAANAAALAASGGAEVHQQSTLSPERIAELIGGLMGDPARLTGMAAAAKSAGKPDAARLLADLTEAIAAGKTVSEFKQGARA